MAAVRQNLLTHLEQNVLLQLKAIASSDTSDFDKLSDNQKKLLFTAALAAGYKTNLELFLDIKGHPEKLGLPPLTAEKVETATVNTQILSTLVADLEDKEALDQKIDTTFKTRTDKDRALIKRMVQMMVRREQAKFLAQTADPKGVGIIKLINQEADPKQPALSLIQRTIREVVNASFPQTHTNYTQTQVDEAVNTLTVITLAGLVNYSDPDSTATAIQVALSNNPDYQTDITNLFHQIEDNVTFTPIPNYENTATTQVTSTIAVSLNKISLPSSEIKTESDTIVLSPPLQDRVEEVSDLAKKFSQAVITNPKTDTALASLTGTTSAEQEKELIRLLVAENLVTRSSPTQEGAAAATVIEKLNPSNPFVDATTIRVVSMGLDTKVLEKHLSQNPTSKLAAFVHQNPNVLRQLKVGGQHLENPKNNLGQEISSRLRFSAVQTDGLRPHLPSLTKPGPLSGLARQYQSLTNRLSGLLPGTTGQIFSAVTHPLQFVQGKIGNFIGNRIVGQFKHWLAEKVVSKIANETVKKAAQFILKKGLQEGVKLLAKEGLKRGLQLFAQTANIAPGAGLLLAAAIEGAFFVGEKLFGAAARGINNLFRTFTGEDFDARTVLALPVGAIAGIGGILGGLGAATSIAAASAGVVLIASGVVGFFLYITVITVAPIITTIAHLESGVSDISRLGIIGESRPALLPPGPLPDSCPQGKPQSGYGINQGPRVGSHTSGWGIFVAGSSFVSEGEALDYLTPINTPVYATHDGQAYYFQAGDNEPSGYGNYVAIIGSCLGHNFLTTYAHLNAGNINRGGPTSVRRGQLIGLSDNTGRSTGPHLHYEIFGLGDIYRYVGP